MCENGFLKSLNGTKFQNFGTVICFKSLWYCIKYTPKDAFSRPQIATLVCNRFMIATKFKISLFPFISMIFFRFSMINSPLSPILKKLHIRLFQELRVKLSALFWLAGSFLHLTRNDQTNLIQKYSSSGDMKWKIRIYRHHSFIRPHANDGLWST